MKIVLISDLHGQEKTLFYLQKIIKKESPQALICSGDITTFGEIDFLNRFFEILSKNNLQGFIVWGNSDSVEIQKAILRSPYNSHLKLRNINGTRIFGVGQVDQPPQIDPTDIKNAILITHQPPLKKLIEGEYDNAPGYHISGHIHYSKQVKKYPSTTHIQVPTLQNGEYATLTITPFKVEFRSIL